MSADDADAATEEAGAADNSAAEPDDATAPEQPEAADVQAGTTHTLDGDAILRLRDLDAGYGDLQILSDVDLDTAAVRASERTLAEAACQ